MTGVARARNPRGGDAAAPKEGLTRYRAGTVVAGKYQLVRPLGSGGMGVVWVAHDSVLDLHVAIKLIPLGRDIPETASARLLQEARTAARLSHSAICRVFEFGETQEGDPYIVMELLHGETLADALESRPQWTSTDAVAMLLPVIDGLATAQRKGVIHRDVKPENIFLAHLEDGRVQPKLLDFGIARFVEVDTGLTTDGTLLGTPDYMSPEQARGESSADPRSDVWSLSVVLYELVAGSRPFLAENYNALLWSILQDEPPSLAELAVADQELSDIVTAGLRKDRDERWPDVATLGVALARWLYAQGIQEDATGVSLRVRWLGDGPVPPPSIPRTFPPERETPHAPGSGPVSSARASGAPPVPSGGGARRPPTESSGEVIVGTSAVPPTRRAAPSRTGAFEAPARPPARPVHKGVWVVAAAAVLALVSGVILFGSGAGASDTPRAAGARTGDDGAVPQPGDGDPATAASGAPTPGDGAPEPAVEGDDRGSAEAVASDATAVAPSASAPAAASAAGRPAPGWRPKPKGPLDLGF